MIVRINKKQKSLNRTRYCTDAKPLRHHYANVPHSSNPNKLYAIYTIHAIHTNVRVFHSCFLQRHNCQIQTDAEPSPKEGDNWSCFLCADSEIDGEDCIGFLIEDWGKEVEGCTCSGCIGTVFGED